MRRTRETPDKCQHASMGSGAKTPGTADVGGRDRPLAVLWQATPLCITWMTALTAAPRGERDWQSCETQSLHTHICLTLNSQVMCWLIKGLRDQSSVALFRFPSTKIGISFTFSVFGQRLLNTAAVCTSKRVWWSPKASLECMILSWIIYSQGLSQNLVPDQILNNSLCSWCYLSDFSLLWMLQNLS